MNQLIPFIVGIISLSVGTIFGYYVRQSIAKRNHQTIEAKIQKRIARAKKEEEEIILRAKEEASKILEEARNKEEVRRAELIKTERLLLKRESNLDQRISNYEEKEKEFLQKVEKVKKIKDTLEELKKEALEKLEKISGLTKEKAKAELLKNIEQEYQKDVLGRIRKLEADGTERLSRRAKEIVATAIQKCALSQAQEITTATVMLPSDKIKGRIIGKEGRNIRTLEKLTGVEILVDEVPEIVTISGFNPIRRQIAKMALEKLIQDGRIQPARIEKTVEEVEKEVASEIKQAGEEAVYDTGVLDLDPKLVQLLGRLRFRTSYGQNVLLHSIEVAHLSSALASEIGANAKVAKKAGLLHDIGKAVDHQVEGSHVDIGIKILEKFGVEKEVIDAMKSHHGDYPAESIEAVLVQVADQISGARPGARKDTLQNYLRRLEDLEKIALSFKGVEKAYAVQAGREIRVFVRPEEVDDLTAHKLAKEIADKIQEELRYPGEIKVNVIREMRVIEYAK